jgi:hypothetical protein
MKAKLLLFLGLFLFPILAQAQAVDRQKLNCFATAVAHAEGFGVRHAIPTRYHNPGDLKSARIYHPIPGQKRLGKGDHVIFESDSAGWTALRDYLAKMVDGRSHRYNPNMTLAQVSRIYAGNWRPWLKTVARELNVEPSTKLCDLLLLPEPPELILTIQAPMLDLTFLQPAPPVLQADNQSDEEDFQY